MTLIELMISMLILSLVCVAWLEIIGIQSAKKEARRREAVERLAGMMDAFMEYHKAKPSIAACGYSMEMTEGCISFPATSLVKPVFHGEVSPGYYLSLVANKSGLPNSSLYGTQWGGCKWLVGHLYDQSDVAPENAGMPFFTLQVCLGF